MKTPEDRVARAICAAYESDVDKYWTFYTEQARGAIAAMREPTRTPEEIIGVDAVAALEAEGYQIEPPEPRRPLASAWVDANGVEHTIEYTSVPYNAWRGMWSNVYVVK